MAGSKIQLLITILLAFMLVQLIFVLKSPDGHREMDRGHGWRDTVARKMQHPDIYEANDNDESELSSLRPIFVITVTNDNLLQKMRLTRLGQTLKLVPQVKWIVVENRPAPSEKVMRILHSIGVDYQQLAGAAKAEKWGEDIANGGWMQRNLALSWLRRKYQKDEEQFSNGKKDGALSESFRGVVYFAEEQYTYDARLFQLIREVHTLGMWPVGFEGGVKVEQAEIDQEGKLKEFQTGRIAAHDPFDVKHQVRDYEISLVSSAISLRHLLHKSDIIFAPDCRGTPTSCFLNGLELGYDDIQMIGYKKKATQLNKGEVYVWYTPDDDSIAFSNEAAFEQMFHHESDMGWFV